MKKSIKTIVSFISVALLLVSLTSCTLIDAMKNGALQASNTTIYASPEADKVIAEFNGYLENSKAEATKITENVSYNAGTPDVFKAGEEAGVLDAAANQLKNFIMSANPGSTSTEITKDSKDNLLNAVNEAGVLDFDFTRNIATENVTNEKSENVVDEENNPVTETKISDNILHLTFNYFVNEITVSDNEAETNENGEAIEETTVIRADDATIESVFGTNKDKQIVLANFDCIKDYIVVSDYEINYDNCIITSDANIETGTLSFVNFQKNMTVTAKAEGVGALASYGEIEIVFALTMNTNYEFTYEEETEGDSSDETTISDETTSEVTEETTSLTDESTEIADESTSADEVTSEQAETTDAEEATTAA